jgi:hypothetical protein
LRVRRIMKEKKKRLAGCRKGSARCHDGRRSGKACFPEKKSLILFDEIFLLRIGFVLIIVF